MALNSSHHILHRMVPLICQALTTASTDETVWREGIRMLCNPKLHTAMSLTASIWLPLILKGLDPSRSKAVILSSLNVLAEMAEILDPMKSCLVKPLRLLGKDPSLGVSYSEELALAARKLGITVLDEENEDINKSITMLAGSASHVNSPLVPITPQAEAPPNSRDQPILAEILDRNLSLKRRTVRHAWSQTLLSPTHEDASGWLHDLFQATLEASAVNEMVICSRLGALIHEELFQTAFLKCYNQILVDKPFKNLVDTALIRFLSDTSVSKDIVNVFLDIIAFFHKEKLELPPAVLDAAKSCGLTHFAGELYQSAPGIALWYAEQETAANLSAENLKNLIEINIRIGASGYDSAWSSLLWLRDDFNIHPDAMWLTQLSHWDTALKRQDHLDEGGPVTTFGSFNTRMICHHAMGQFQQGYNLAQNLFESLDDHQKRKTAHWVTAAAWHMGDYESMADCLAFHPKGTSKSLYKAIIDVHLGQYASAFHHISKAQALSYDEVQVQLKVGPQVALKALAKTEVLVELQEVIEYKSQPETRDHILDVWKARFKRSHADANSWLKRLQIWTLACPPSTLALQHCYLDCAKLCESSGMHEAAWKIIRDVTPAVHPPGCKVEYTRLRFDWKNAAASHDAEKMTSVLQKLDRHTTTFLTSLGVDRAALEYEGLGLRPISSAEELSPSTTNVLARRFYRLAQWSEMIQGNFWLSDPDSEVYRYYSLAYKLDNLWYNGAYSLSQAAMNIFEANSCSRRDTVAVIAYVVPAIRGLFQAVRSRETPEKMIKALLRLVTLWFRYGEADAVLVEVQQQLDETSVSAWLLAIPQLIARLGTRHEDLQGVLIGLLKNIASQYPHAVIWPLFTASQTRKAEHEDAARVILDFICTMPDGTKLVNQAELVGRELIRTSISWIEKWRHLIDRCLPRQELMEIAWHEVPILWEDQLAKLNEPETPDEEQFVQQFGARIKTIHKTLVKYRSTKQINLVNNAYTDLFKLFGDLESVLEQWKAPGSKLQLASTAPRLLHLRECLLTVPGQYDHMLKLDDQSFIDSIHPTVEILPSKMIPRKLVIRSFSSDFTFLLKGNEDLRGDERIMQLFTLINTLLNHQAEAFSRNLHLLPYEVIPLSPSAGLIGWVMNTQQLQAMIQANRDKNRASNLSNKELASLLGYDPKTFDPKHDKPRLDPPLEMDRYDKLPLDTKVERLKAALSHSKQTDLRDVLWQRSPSAEIWMRRRTNFARTLGALWVIIGLGDRHGSNILVDQANWGALHIDFGDLFGTAQERTYLPEKVPFRLTRMMTNSFELAASIGHEVPGSRGTYKQASIVTLEVLRGSRSSLLAMLEAFLYDPLLSWTVGTSTSGSGSVPDSDAKLHTQKNRNALPAVTAQNRHDPTARATAAAVAASMFPHPHTSRSMPQSVAPARPQLGGENDSDVYNRIENSLIDVHLDPGSYMAKASHTGMTNSKALNVLAQIERKLVGYTDNSEQPLRVKSQVQHLIEEATDLRNLAQGYVLGWIPHW